MTFPSSRWTRALVALALSTLGLFGCNDARPQSAEGAEGCPANTIQSCTCGNQVGSRDCVDGVWAACECAEDEGVAPPITRCGDGTCEGVETVDSCPEDCAAAGVCGDGVCDPDESAFRCPEDCLQAPECGDGICESFENAVNCPEDCFVDECGDGICGETESGVTCPEDCGNLACGDGICEPPENANNCPADCRDANCGDNVCEPPEDRASCPEDCGDVACGDGWCDEGEECDADCDGTCGDGRCDLYETPFGCSADCDVSRCGDERCGRQEHAFWCVDCAQDACGNGQCDLFEDGLSCPDDCRDDACDPDDADVSFAFGEPGGTIPLVWDASDGATSAVERGITIALEAPPVSLNVTVAHGRLPVFLGEIVTELGPLEDLSVETLAYSGFAAPSLILPNAEVTLETPTCLRFFPVTSGDQVGNVGEVRIAIRWEDVGRIVAVDAVRIGGADISNSQIRSAIERANETWSANGAPDLVLEQIIDILGPAVGPLEGPEIAEMRARELGRPDAVNLYLYERLDSDVGVLGFAGGIPGAPFDGYASSGVVVQVDGHRAFFGNDLDSTLLGDTIAHELGHQLGLFHTTESSGGVYDPIEDTPQCPANRDDNGDGFVDSFECEDRDGSYLMFWLALERFEAAPVSPMQSDVLLRHPVAR